MSLWSFFLDNLYNSLNIWQMFYARCYISFSFAPFAHILCRSCALTFCLFLFPQREDLCFFVVFMAYGIDALMTLHFKIDYDGTVNHLCIIHFQKSWFGFVSQSYLRPYSWSYNRSPLSLLWLKLSCVWSICRFGWSVHSGFDWPDDQ